MTTALKSFIAVFLLILLVPVSYAGRGPDEMQFQQRIQKMDQLIEQSRSAATPAEREKLMMEHMQEMRACMDMMKGDGGMMGMHSGKGGMGMDMKGMDMNMNDRMMDMEKRMNMMQMMMDQMMKQQEQSMMKK